MGILVDQKHDCDKFYHKDKDNLSSERDFYHKTNLQLLQQLSAYHNLMIKEQNVDKMI